MTWRVEGRARRGQVGSFRRGQRMRSGSASDASEGLRRRRYGSTELTWTIIRGELFVEESRPACCRTEFRTEFRRTLRKGRCGRYGDGVGLTATRRRGVGRRSGRELRRVEISRRRSCAQRRFPWSDQIDRLVPLPLQADRSVPLLLNTTLSRPRLFVFSDAPTPFRFGVLPRPSNSIVVARHAPDSLRRLGEDELLDFV